MNEKMYFYLEGVNTKGPFSFAEIIEKNLSRETLIWTEGEKLWHPLHTYPELNEKLPPPPPVSSETQSISEHPIDVNQFEYSNVKARVALSILFFLIIVLGLLWGVSFLIVKQEKGNYLAEINERIDRIFDGKSSVLDGIKYGVKGDLNELSTSKFSEGGLRFALGAESDKELHAVFKCTSGGFTIYKLTRVPGGFDKEIYKSADMGYKQPKSEYVPAQYTSYLNGENYKINDGYYRQNYRPDIQECYNGAFDYLTKEDKSNSYVAGIVNDIKTFDDIRNDFYYIDNVYPTRYYSSSINSIKWTSSNNYTACVYNNYWKVFYGTEGYHYEIIEGGRPKKLFLIIGFGLSFLLIITLVIIKSSKPQYFTNLSIFGKHWKVQDDSHNFSYYFEHSFFSPNRVTKLYYGRAISGKLVFSGRGRVLQLNLNDGTMELYKINKHTDDSLFLFDINSNLEKVFIFNK